MNDKFRKRVLLVDDDSIIREVMGMLLNEEGYELATAADGLDALTQIKLAAPDLILSDLNMPRMSGYELLSVVRLRFSSIPVIAMSGDYDSDQSCPDGVIADAFFSKSRGHPEELLRKIAELVRTTVTRPISHQLQASPSQIPRYGKDSNGAALMTLTCTECLRSFPLGAPHMISQEIQQASCPFCVAQVQYASGYSVSGAAPHAISSGQAGSVPA
ncbi:MAG: response regulator [Terracidiphilus sp.]